VTLLLDQADLPAPSATDRRAVWIAAFVLAAVASFYLARGMPWVHTDDLAFTGAAIDLARTGQLTNHTMDGWLAAFGTSKFYVQLPFYSYSLAAWIHLFGASTTSFISFEWVCYGMGLYGLIRVFGRFGLPLGMRLLLATMYLTFLIREGFRPEAEASGLMFLGLSLFDTGAPFRRKLVALLLLGFGLLTYPLMVGPAAAFAIALLCLPRPTLRDLPRAWLLPVVLAGAVVVVAFLAMIHFELGPFFAVFEAHRQTRADADGTLLGFFRLITEYQELALTLPPVLLLGVAAVFVLARWRRVELQVRVLVLACAGAALACIVTYVAKAPPLVVLLAFCAACALASERSFRRYRWPAVAALAALYAWNQSLWIVTATQRRFPDQTALRVAHDAALRAGRDLVVDSSTARYVFDYHLPDRTRYLNFLKPQWNEFVTLQEKKPEAFWVVSTGFLNTASDGKIALARDCPRIVVEHHKFNSLPLRPDDPLVIP
jgi:hypothetical protein